MTTWLRRFDRLIIGLVGLVVFGLLVGLGCIKYTAFGYNSFDLAYFSQTLWWFGRGKWFFQTLHPHLTLGDHAEWVLAALAPLYALVPDPRTLIVLQVAALLAPVWPLYRLAKSRTTEQSLIPLFVCLAYLLYPSVQGAALFEFHALAFAVWPLFMALLAFGEKRWGSFVGWCGLALLVREDVALVVVAFGWLAFFENGKNKERWQEFWHWVVTPMLMGGVWFVVMMKLIGGWAPVGGYKFGIYYTWLQSATLLTGLQHLLTMNNLEMGLGFLLPVLGLALLAPAGLMLAAGPLAQIVLSAPGGSTVVTSTHYSLLFLPGIFYALVLGSVKLARGFKVGKWEMGKLEARMAAWLALVGLGYTFLVLSPIPKAIVFAARQVGRAADFHKVLELIPGNAAVAASYRFLPQLSSREQLYSLHYAFLGMTQFAEESYALPDNVDLVVLDLDDLETYRAQFTHIGWARPYYAGGFARLAALFDGRTVCWLGQVVVGGQLSAPTEFKNKCLALGGKLLTPLAAKEVVGELSLRRRAEQSREAWLVFDDWLGTRRQDMGK